MVNEDTLKLKEILERFDALMSAERALKDERKTGLDELKEELEAVQDAIGAARGVGDDLAGTNLSLVIEAWDNYCSAKKRSVDAVRERKETVDQARSALEETIGSAKQSALPFETATIQ